MDVTEMERDISHGEFVEKELNTFVGKRDKQRRESEGERPEEAAWVASERLEREKRREKNRIAWCDYYRRLAGGYRTFADECDAAADRLEALGETA